MVQSPNKIRFCQVVKKQPAKTWMISYFYPWVKKTCVKAKACFCTLQHTQSHNPYILDCILLWEIPRLLFLLLLLYINMQRRTWLLVAKRTSLSIRKEDSNELPTTTLVHNSENTNCTRNLWCLQHIKAQSRHILSLVLQNEIQQQSTANMSSRMFSFKSRILCHCSNKINNNNSFWIST